MQEEKFYLHLRFRRSMVRLIPLLKRDIFIPQIAENKGATGGIFCYPLFGEICRMMGLDLQNGGDLAGDRLRWTYPAGCGMMGKQ